MNFAGVLGGILVALAATGCEKVSSSGELSRGECVDLAIRRDNLKNGELGRTNDANRRQDVDRCVRSGTKRWAECIRFARSAGDVSACDEQL